MKPRKDDPKPRKGWVIVYGNYMHPILWKSRQQAHRFAKSSGYDAIRRATLILDEPKRRTK